jgi:hypothetical protein
MAKIKTKMILSSLKKKKIKHGFMNFFCLKT